MADHDENEISGAARMDRRGLLKCMSWAGTGVLWTLSGGVPRSIGLVGEALAAEKQAGSFTFLQISDSHVGFDKPANPCPRHVPGGDRQGQCDAGSARLYHP